MHAVDQRLRRWQSRPKAWQQLLHQVFGRSTPFELSGISVGIIDGNRGRTIDHEFIGEAPAIAVEDDVEVVALDRPTTSNARHSFDPSGDCSLRLGHAETRCYENITQA